MIEQLASTRCIGVSIPDVSDYTQPLPSGKWSQFFAALSERMQLVEIIQPRLSRGRSALNLAVAFNPSRARWIAQAGYTRRRADLVSAVVERELERLSGSFDLIVQLQTLCAPGTAPHRRPYVIYTDNTFALTRRFHPRWAPLAEPQALRWMQYERDVCARALTVFTFSEFARRSVIEDYGCSPSRVVAIGAGANQLVDSVDDKQYERPVALFVGRPFDPKGGPTLLEAWRAVRARLPDAELIVAGPRGDPPRGLGPGVTWLGRVDRRELDAAYARASAFVLPTMFDAWGHVFVEAMGYGLPCIGTDCCAIPELIEEGVTGRLVPRGESEPLAAALIELLSDPAKAARMGRAAHARVLERLTWGQVIDRLMSHLASLEWEPAPRRA